MRAPRPGARPLRVLFAPDSFKGSLSSVEVARALADGWKQARPDDVIGLAPLADGGDGTMEAVAAASPRGLERHRVRVSDPLGRPVDAEFLTVGDGTTALVEMAAASGLARVGGGERDALRASTDGTGDLMRAAIAGGARALVLGLGGSATTDGGSGLLRALGARLLDANGHDIAPGGAALAAIGELRLDGLPAELATVHLTVASDVRNPLLGPMGAAAVFGPQKGASPDQVVALESALTRWAAVLEGTSGRSVRDVPGTGAAGGTLAGLLAIEGRLAGLVVRPGIEVVMELTRFEDRLAACDLVVTGEGRLDAQTALGKTVWGVAQRARAAGVRIVAVVGSFGEGGRDVAAGLLARVVATSDRMADTEQAMASGAAPLRAAAARLAATIDLP